MEARRNDDTLPSDVKRRNRRAFYISLDSALDFIIVIVVVGHERNHIVNDQNSRHSPRAPVLRKQLSSEKIVSTDLWRSEDICHSFSSDSWINRAICFEHAMIQTTRRRRRRRRRKERRREKEREELKTSKCEQEESERITKTDNASSLAQSWTVGLTSAQ